MSFKSRVLEAYSEAAPYISDMNWVKKIILKALEESTSLEEFEKKMNRLCNRQDEIFRKSDLRILLIFLKKG